jgi:hypothetical protein
VILLDKCKALSSNSSAAKRERERKKEGRKEGRKERRKCRRKRISSCTRGLVACVTEFTEALFALRYWERKQVTLRSAVQYLRTRTLSRP